MSGKDETSDDWRHESEWTSLANSNDSNEWTSDQNVAEADEIMA